MYYDSEIPSYLKMVKGELPFQTNKYRKGVRWLFAHGMVLTWEHGMYCIYDDWKYTQGASNDECGECIVVAKKDKDIIAEIKYYNTERGLP